MSVFGLIFIAISICNAQHPVDYPEGGKTYTIKSWSGYCLQTKNSNTDENGAVELGSCSDSSHSHWTYQTVPGYGESDGVYYWVNGHSGKCLTVGYNAEGGENGAVVYQFSCVGATSQAWKGVWDEDHSYQWEGPISDEFFSNILEYGGRCLSDYAGLTVYDCVKHQKNQMFRYFQI